MSSGSSCLQWSTGRVIGKLDPGSAQKDAPPISFWENFTAGMKQWSRFPGGCTVCTPGNAQSRQSREQPDPTMKLLLLSVVGLGSCWRLRVKGEGDTAWTFSYKQLGVSQQPGSGSRKRDYLWRAGWLACFLPISNAGLLTLYLPTRNADCPSEMKLLSLPGGYVKNINACHRCCFRPSYRKGLSRAPARAPCIFLQQTFSWANKQ